MHPRTWRILLALNRSWAPSYNPSAAVKAHTQTTVSPTWQRSSGAAIQETVDKLIRILASTTSILNRIAPRPAYEVYAARLLSSSFNSLNLFTTESSSSSLSQTSCSLTLKFTSSNAIVLFIVAFSRDTLRNSWISCWYSDTFRSRTPISRLLLPLSRWTSNFCSVAPAPVAYSRREDKKHALSVSLLLEASWFDRLGLAVHFRDCHGEIYRQCKWLLCVLLSLFLLCCHLYIPFAGLAWATRSCDSRVFTWSLNVLIICCWLSTWVLKYNMFSSFSWLYAKKAWRELRLLLCLSFRGESIPTTFWNWIGW